MLSSPLRQCFVTKKYFPRDLLVRLAPASKPAHLWHPKSTSPEQIIIADGVEHPSYKPPKCRRGFYVSCRRDAVVTLMERFLFKRFSPNLDMLPSAVDQVSHLLRVRVLQELELLTKRLSSHPCHPHPESTQQPSSPYIPIIHRLSRTELQTMLTTNALPPKYEGKGAIAVLIVPPVNKDPTTGAKVKGDMGSSPLDDGSHPERKDFKSGFRPVSLLLSAEQWSISASHNIPSGRRITDSDPLTEETTPTLVERERLPLYHSTSLMPSPAHRVLLHQFIKQILNLERNAAVATRQRGLFEEEGSQSSKGAACEHNEVLESSDKLSHAYLLCSHPNTVGRADVIGLAISLWRVRMYEGEGWEEPADGRIAIPDI
jgi:predicted RNA-binding protein YlxR (DUF448 family)